MRRRRRRRGSARNNDRADAGFATSGSLTGGPGRRFSLVGSLSRSRYCFRAAWNANEGAPVFGPAGRPD
jgi:hypothetical protein